MSFENRVTKNLDFVLIYQSGQLGVLTSIVYVLIRLVQRHVIMARFNCCNPLTKLHSRGTIT